MYWHPPKTTPEISLPQSITLKPNFPGAEGARKTPACTGAHTHGLICFCFCPAMQCFLRHSIASDWKGASKAKIEGWNQASWANLSVQLSPCMPAVLEKPLRCKGGQHSPSFARLPRQSAPGFFPPSGSACIRLQTCACSAHESGGKKRDREREKRSREQTGHHSQDSEKTMQPT